MTVLYEWDLETWSGPNWDEENCECLDHHHGDKLADVPLPASPNERLTLVRDADGLRLWAYIDESRMLPRFFSRLESDGQYYETDVAVPKRFHREIARMIAGPRSKS